MKFMPLSLLRYLGSLGRARAVLRGLQVAPGVIDNDFTGEIKIIASVSSGVMTVPLGERLAQLLLLLLQHFNDRYYKKK